MISEGFSHEVRGLDRQLIQRSHIDLIIDTSLSIYEHYIHFKNLCNCMKKTPPGVVTTVVLTILNKLNDESR